MRDTPMSDSKVTRAIVAVLLISGLVSMAPLSACEDTCDKCAKQSEFSWNPQSTYVTERLERFYSLDAEIHAAFSANDFSSARALIDEYLELADVYRCNWNYGNAIHDANRVLGLMSLEDGDVDEAANYLIKAGKSPGSPQLNTFGPELDLADELLKLGRYEAVTAYLKDIQSFWEMDDGRLDRWLASIEQGERPQLKRFAELGTWQILLYAFIASWPFLVTAIVLFVFRNKITRKWLFALTSVIAGYAAMFATEWVLTRLMTSAISEANESGMSGSFTFLTYAMLIATFVIPLLLILVISRSFVAKNA